LMSENKILELKDHATKLPEITNLIEKLEILGSFNEEDFWAAFGEAFLDRNDQGIDISDFADEDRHMLVMLKLKGQDQKFQRLQEAVFRLARVENEEELFKKLDM
jgi:hypothetical protein